MGELDVRMLGEIFGGAGPSADLAKTWDGGVYYAAQSRSAVAAGKGGSTASIGLIYLSQWTTPEAARAFAGLYEASLSRKYKQLKPETAPGGLVAAAAPAPPPSFTQMRYATEEGPVVITTSDRQVFVSEGFAEDLADSLQQKMLEANAENLARSLVGDGNKDQAAELSAPLVRLFGGMGMMKAGLKLRPVSGPRVY
jgi:hypothetical protein